MVGWTGKPAWAGVDLFNLFDVNPHTTDLTWELVQTKSLRLIKKLSSGGPRATPPPGVSAMLICDFKSDLFDILYPFKMTEGMHQREDATTKSRKELSDELKKINDAKLVGYQRTWDATNGKPDNWLGTAGIQGDTTAQAGGSAIAAAVRAAQDSAYAAQGAVGTGAPGAPGAYHAIVEDHPDGAEERPILIEEDGTQDDPITLGGDEAPAEARVDNTRALVRMPLHQRNQFMQLAPWKASPVNFRYVIAPSRLREMAKRHTGGSRYAIVIGVVRRPTWDVEDTYPEYICIASLEGGKALTIRVKTYSVEGQTLEKWPGGGQSYMTLERIVERDYLFPPFCNQFNKDRLRAYLQKMAEIGGMPRVREMVLAIRSGD